MTATLRTLPVLAAILSTTLLARAADQTTFTANAFGNGSVGLFVPGTQPTINPFLFVIEILGA